MASYQTGHRQSRSESSGQSPICWRYVRGPYGQLWRNGVPGTFFIFTALVPSGPPLIGRSFFHVHLLDRPDDRLPHRFG
jgi:hypothetical protein